MEITPACYAHLVSPLLPIAKGKVAVVLEGGYCLNSLAEGAALTLKTLLGDPCPLMEPLELLSDSIQESILNSIFVHKPYWHCLQIQDTYNLEDLNNTNPQPNLHTVSEIFIGGPPIPEKFMTRDCYPLQSKEFLKRVEERLNHLKISMIEYAIV
jgi:histone deacetylase 6